MAKPRTIPTRAPMMMNPASTVASFATHPTGGTRPAKATRRHGRPSGSWTAAAPSGRPALREALRLRSEGRFRRNVRAGGREGRSPPEQEGPVNSRYTKGYVIIVGLGGAGHS